ncbi:FAD:protein FMN transferase [Spirosoma luteum]|uniref:FAD:protein FMN transferase n=1 Tax=Spirosoma luteum TaxID=431553 RepID=UPI000360FB31|nr:FAD:protein FMN transferase [Spirosoma luteum]
MFIRLVILFLLWPVDTISAQSESLLRFTFQRGLMGTQFNVIFYAPDSLIAQRAYAAVSGRMDSLNYVMSDYLDDSEINRLSATAGSGRYVPVSYDLFNVLQKAKTIAKKSDGLYDPTIGPLSQLWRRAVRRQIFPSVRQRRRARRAVGYRLMDLDSATRSVKLNRSGMRLDLGGIGQGFALDEAMAVLHRFDIFAALVDIGGDILADEAPPGTVGWCVGIGSGKADGSDTTTMLLAKAAITTSGDAYRFLEHNGHRYSHIMNPRSGLGLKHFVRVTVLAPDGYRADALTKVFSVAGWRKSRRLIKQFPAVTVLIVEKKKGRSQQWQSAPF